jgi:hypothetical protein
MTKRSMTGKLGMTGRSRLFFGKAGIGPRTYLLKYSWSYFLLPVWETKHTSKGDEME